MEPQTESGIIVVLLANILLQVAQMFFDFRRDIKANELQMLRNEISTLRTDISQAKGRITVLEKEVFELTKENSFLSGLLESQTPKEVVKPATKKK